LGIMMEDRSSDSPYIEVVWRARSDDIGTFISAAHVEWDFVVTRTPDGQTRVGIQGPETKASDAPVPQNAEFFGILFKPGVFMPHLPPQTLMNSGIALPGVTRKSFWLRGAAWEIPTFDNAEAFINRLVKSGDLLHEPIVEAVRQGSPVDMSLRSVQRRFRYSTGFTHRTLQKIERAQRAAGLLQAGLSILDTVNETGYFDQAHMTKSLKHFMGQTPTQIVDKTQAG
jgi:AraC-like DNA-binding protein